VRGIEKILSCEKSVRFLKNVLFLPKNFVLFSKTIFQNFALPWEMSKDIFVSTAVAYQLWLKTVDGGFRFAVASYTEGLKARGGDVVVNTQLYTNRAAAQFHIGNYRYWEIHVKKNICLRLLCVRKPHRLDRIKLRKRGGSKI